MDLGHTMTRSYSPAILRTMSALPAPGRSKVVRILHLFGGLWSKQLTLVVGVDADAITIGVSVGRER